VYTLLPRRQDVISPYGNPECLVTLKTMLFRVCLDDCQTLAHHKFDCDESSMRKMPAVTLPGFGMKK
jgi:hypothetical protein